MIDLVMILFLLVLLNFEDLKERAGSLANLRVRGKLDLLKKIWYEVNRKGEGLKR